MTNWLAKAADSGKSAWNIVKSAGPLLISQSEKTSQMYTKHKARLASVDMAKELIVAEAKMLNEVRKELLLKHANSEGAESFRIKKDIEELDRSVRQLKIHTKALLYLPEQQEQSESMGGDAVEVSPHWTDKFNELAKARNEEWREDLLARALATEASNPKSVTPRVLWLIGTLDQDYFHAFASILDVSSNLDGKFMIPLLEDTTLVKKPIPNCYLGHTWTIGHLVAELQDINVIAHSASTTYPFKKNSTFDACYLDERYVITCKESDLVVRGYFLTGIGTSIAALYTQKYNELGKEIFDAWIASLDRSQFEVHKFAKQAGGV